MCIYIRDAHYIATSSHQRTYPACLAYTWQNASLTLTSYFYKAPPPHLPPPNDMYSVISKVNMVHYPGKLRQFYLDGAAVGKWSIGG